MIAEWMILPPFLAALLIAGGILGKQLIGEEAESATRRIAVAGASVSALACLTAFLLKAAERLEGQLSLGTWMESGAYRIPLSFTFDWPALLFASLVGFFSLLVLRFSCAYMHRERGFHRFFLILCLFNGAMLLVATAGSAVLAFTGWELAGVCSYLLIAYAYDRPVAAENATRAFITNRLGDAGFVAGIILAFTWIGGIEWAEIVKTPNHLAEWQSEVLAGCFLLAAIAKSAQVPLAPWIARAMEGPTPSSAIFYGAIMVHAGIYLMIRLAPLFDQAPIAMTAMAGVGLLTALYGFICGLSQTDVKSALIFSTSGQVGLMFFEAGLGYWNLALCHLCAHAVVRGYQFITAPSLMHHIVGQPARPVPPFIARRRRLYMASLQRWWLEPLGDWLLVKPLSRLARDLYLFENQVVERFWGSTPSVATGTQADRGPGTPDISAIGVSGTFGHVVATLASLLHWIEDRLVMQGVGQHTLDAGRRLGVQLNRLETLLNEPRYLVLFIVCALLAVV